MKKSKHTEKFEQINFVEQTINVDTGGATHQVNTDDKNYLTTQQGMPIADDQNSLKIGVRGPTLLEDMVFRDKLFHFDHERIPERVVHARGFGAHGYFETYQSLSEFTKAHLFQKKVKKLQFLYVFQLLQVTKVHLI